MSPRKNGNVDGAAERVIAEQVFEPGDIVALTASALRINRISGMTPRLMYSIGHKNEFLVLDTFEDPEDGICVVLECCRGNYVDRNKNGKDRCQGHPGIYFERIDRIRLPKKGDKSSSIHLPFGIGQLIGLHWEQDEDNPKLRVDLPFDQKIETLGPLAQMFKKIAENNGIL